MKILKVGNVWKSQMNGAVYDLEGISPTILCGCHSGVEPKILDIMYEQRFEIEDSPSD